MNKYICVKEYTLQEYDALGHATEIFVAVGSIMDEGNKYLNMKYCHLINEKCNEKLNK
jgi:hypothetical protein